MMRIRLLGTLELTGSDGSTVLSVLSQPKRMGLLAFLVASHPRGFHSRDKLLAHFWPESNEERARNALRQSLHFLRRSLGDEAILSRGEEVGANIALLSCDVIEFDDAIQKEDWKGALELYRGPLLDGFHLSGSPTFHRWLEEERERLRVLAVGSGDKLSEVLEARGDLGGAVEAARRVAELSPASGVAAQRLIALLGRQGDRSGAIRAYETFKARLWEDFELDPPDELRDTVAAIRQRGGSGAKVGSELEADEGDSEGGSEEFSQTQVAEKSRTSRWTRAGLPVAVGENGGGPLREGRVRKARYTTPRMALTALFLLSAVAVIWISTVVDPEGRTPVFLSAIDLIRPDSLDFEFRDSLNGRIQHVLEGSRRVRPVEATASFEFTLAINIAADSIRCYVRNPALGKNPIASWSHPKPNTVGVREVTTVGESVVRELELAVGGQSDLPSPMLGTANEDAYSAYNIGRSLWELRDPSRFNAALNWFQRAVSLDPNYAQAHAAIADVYNLLGAYDYGLLSPDVAYPAAIEAASEAVRLDPDFAGGHAALATTKFFYEWDFEGAKAEYEEAVELDPSYLHARHWGALREAADLQVEEAMDRIEEAIEADSSEFILRSAKGRVLYFMGEYEEALQVYQEALGMRFEFMPARLGHALTAMVNQDYVVAGRGLETAESIFGTRPPILLGLQGYLFGIEGDTAAAKGKLAELEATELNAAESQGFVPSEYFVMIHLGLRDYEAALDRLYQAFENGSSSMTLLRVDPLLHPLREMERFKELVELVEEGRFR